MLRPEQLFQIPAGYGMPDCYDHFEDGLGGCQSAL